MGEASKIQWTTSTFNPWIGCTKVSAGCENCYAEVNRFVTIRRAQGRELWGPKAERHIVSEAKWREVRQWNELAKKSGEPWRVFCASLADVFEDRDVLAAPRARLFELIEATPALTWMLLTKRPENMTTMAPAAWRSGWPRNIWALTTVEDQKQAELRIPELQRVPAEVLGLSAEPLLGPLDLRRWLQFECHHEDGYVEYDTNALICRECESLGMINWLIIGGESGPEARPFDLAWARSLIAQCREAGVAPFFKQAGAHPIDGRPDCTREWWQAQRLRLRDRMGGDLSELPEGLRVREWPR